jgi:hypothetical protein
MREKHPNFCRTNFLRMAFIVKKNVAADPTEIGFLGAIAEMFEPNQLADGLEKGRFQMITHNTSTNKIFQ